MSSWLPFPRFRGLVFEHKGFENGGEEDEFVSKRGDGKMGMG